jgi:hypothetical protein
MSMKRACKTAALCASFALAAGCAGTFKSLRVIDLTDARVTDLSLTKKVTGRREFLFFSTTKTGIFLEGSIQGMVTDYQGNPIEGVTVKAEPDTGKSKTGEAESGELAGVEENVAAPINLSFAPGISDTMGMYKIRFSLPLVDKEVDMRGKLRYNPGWDQAKINLGKAYEPQMKDSPFRLYYNLNTGVLAFAEGVRKVIVQPVGEGEGKLKTLPGSAAPQAPAAKQGEGAPAAPTAGDKGAEEDLFKGFDFGQ